MQASLNDRSSVLCARALLVAVLVLPAAGAPPAPAQQATPPDRAGDPCEEFRKAGLRSDFEKLVFGTEEQVASVMAKLEPKKDGATMVATLFFELQYRQGEMEPWRERAIMTFLAVHGPEEPKAIEYLVRRVDFHWPIGPVFVPGDYYPRQWPVADYPAAVLLERYVGAGAGPAIFKHLARTPPEEVTDKQLELFAYVLRDLYGRVGYKTLEAVVQTAEMQESEGAKENRRRLLEAVRKTQANVEKGWRRTQIP